MDRQAKRNPFSWDAAAAAGMAEEPNPVCLTTHTHTKEAGSERSVRVWGGPRATQSLEVLKLGRH